MDVELARKAISLVDLTDLNDGCTPEAIDDLCGRASRYARDCNMPQPARGIP